MSSGTVHRTVAASAIGVVLLKHDVDRGELTLKPLAGSLLAALATNLPDILEPATNPNHRQFFHSFVFAGAIGYGLKMAHDWQPEDKLEELLRFGVLVAGYAYLTHLALDAMTAKSLPLLGRV
jgi:inner membrane protein